MSNMSTEVESSAPHEPLLVRLHRALGPLAGGLILDFVDLATFGPVGLAGGFLIGGAVAWWISSIYELPTGKRLLFAALAMAYVGMPFTGVLPVATLISATARFKERTVRAVEAHAVEAKVDEDAESEDEGA